MSMLKKAAMDSFRLALIQMKVGTDKIRNVTNAIAHIRQAVADQNPRVVALPECFNSPYGTKYFNEYAETIPDGYTTGKLSEIAKELNIYLVGGTIPERDTTDSSTLYNTCTVWSPSGELIAKHRKMHLFDIDVKGGIRFKESDVLTGGSEFTSFQIDNSFKIGVGICYDIRFEEMARIYRNDGCDMLIYPAAFNMTTGPLHWELLQRARANDLQLYVASISPARDPDFEYVAWGHSMVVDPWGKVVITAKESEEIVYADIDMSLNEKVRAQIPISRQRRTDLYETVSKK
ncbi:hypothetical protein HA402_003334 [Bradysia odoriphaga]|nr:hypothetical protein HA402_003334 [Bradysia odoriphaga]